MNATFSAVTASIRDINPGHGAVLSSVCYPTTWKEAEAVIDALSGGDIVFWDHTEFAQLHGLCVRTIDPRTLCEDCPDLLGWYDDPLNAIRGAYEYYHGPFVQRLTNGDIDAGEEA